MCVVVVVGVKTPAGTRSYDAASFLNRNRDCGRIRDQSLPLPLQCSLADLEVSLDAVYDFMNYARLAVHREGDPIVLRVEQLLAEVL